MATKRKIMVGGARAVTGALGIAVVAITVAAATLLPVPEVVAQPPAQSITPQASEQVRVCPGPVLALAENEAAATSVSAFGKVKIVSGTDAPSSDTTSKQLVPFRADAATQGDGSDSADDSAVSIPKGTSPVVVSIPADPAAETPAAVVGSQSQTAFGDEISGFSAAECGIPAGDSWLAAGSTEIGRTTLILLSNPSEVAASVDLEIFSESGQVTAPGAEGIIVEAGTERVLPLSGLAPNVQSPVVHVSTRGGLVHASLQHGVVRGLVPGGIELVGATAAPAIRQVIPGFVFRAPNADIPNDTGATITDASAALRIFAASDTGAQVKVSVVSEDATGTGTAFTTTVAAHTVADVPLEGIPAGNYSVIVSSSEPVVASARGATTGKSMLDFAWFMAAETLNDSFLVSVADGPSPRLHLHNEGQFEAPVTITPIAGPGASAAARSQSRAIQPDEAAAFKLVAGTRYEVSGGEFLAAAVTYSKDGKYSSFTISPTSPLAEPLTVYRG